MIYRTARFIVADADDLADMSNWRAAERLYKQTEDILHQEGNAPLELHAKVSPISAQKESATIPISALLAKVDRALALPAAPRASSYPLPQVGKDYFGL